MVEPGFHFLQADPIDEGWQMGADVVICSEVAEHVYESRAEALVSSVCAIADKRVIWSAARPGQEWEGHVNLQLPAYWLEKFDRNGFAVNKEKTTCLRKLMLDLRAQHCGASENFFVMDRR
jgi:hypothetical protein